MAQQGRLYMAGRKIDDHSFWAGSKGKHSPFPDGPHKCKDESSAEGVGALSHYEDTTEAIKSQQEMNKKRFMAILRSQDTDINFESAFGLGIPGRRFHLF